MIFESLKNPLLTMKSIAIMLNLVEYNINLEEMGTWGQRARRPHQWISLWTGSEVLRRSGEHCTLRMARRHH